MASICAGVGDDPDLDSGQHAVAACAEPNLRSHLMARGGADELLFAREFPLHRPTGLQCSQYAEILGQHFLLAAKPAADPLREDVHVPRAQTKDVTELVLGNKRRLRAGAHMDAPVRSNPGDRTVRLEM